MMKLARIPYLIFFVLLFGCRNKEDKRCDANFLGVWNVDTTGLSSNYKKIIEERNWVNLKLVANENGSFKIHPSDKYLKQCEGKWYASYNSDDAICVLNYKENYYKGYISVLSGFEINGIFEDSTQFLIKFKKE
jgi:hypothetical protein